MHMARALVSCLLVLLYAPAATALVVIDNFLEGATTVIDDETAGPTTEEMGGFSTANTVGGTRFVSVTALGTGGLPATLPATATITPAGALLAAGEVGTFLMQWDGVLSGVGDGSSGALNLNLLGFPTIDVTAAVLVTGALSTVRLWDSSGSQLSSSQTLANGVTQFPLSQFTNVDLDDIQAIQLRVTNVGTSAASPEVLLQGIVAVPEPGTLVLVGLGLGALALTRRTASAR